MICFSGTRLQVLHIQKLLLQHPICSKICNKGYRCRRKVPKDQRVPSLLQLTMNCFASFHGCSLHSPIDAFWVASLTHPNSICYTCRQPSQFPQSWGRRGTSCNHLLGCRNCTEHCDQRHSAQSSTELFK